MTKYIMDILKAVFHLHQQQPPIIHRDIKPENILCFGDILKLADFGSSNTKDKILKETMCGTPEYLAPEMILKEGHDEKIDVWCIGVIFFELLFGYTPFAETLLHVNIEDKEKLLNLLTDRILVST